MALEFVTDDWEFTYGKRPYGYGNWAFSWQRHPDVLSNNILWCHGTYGEAKKQARELLKWKQQNDNWPKDIDTLWLLT